MTSTIFDSTVSRIASGIFAVADAIKAHGESQIIAAKIRANSDQRAAGNTPMFPNPENRS